MSDPQPNPGTSKIALTEGMSKAYSQRKELYNTTYDVIQAFYQVVEPDHALYNHDLLDENPDKKFPLQKTIIEDTFLLDLIAGDSKGLLVKANQQGLFSRNDFRTLCTDVARQMEEIAFDYRGCIGGELPANQLSLTIKYQEFATAVQFIELALDLTEPQQPPQNS